MLAETVPSHTSKGCMVWEGSYLLGFLSLPLGTRLFLYFSHLPWPKCGNVPMKFAGVDRVECGTEQLDGQSQGAGWKEVWWSCTQELIIMLFLARSALVRRYIRAERLSWINQALGEPGASAARQLWKGKKQWWGVLVQAAPAEAALSSTILFDVKVADHHSPSQWHHWWLLPLQVSLTPEQPHSPSSPLAALTIRPHLSQTAEGSNSHNLQSPTWNSPEGPVCDLSGSLRVSLACWSVGGCQQPCGPPAPWMPRATVSSVRWWRSVHPKCPLWQDD